MGTSVFINPSATASNPFNQDLNTTDSPTFDDLDLTGNLGAVDGDFSGDVSIDGTLTTEGDVNFDDGDLTVSGSVTIGAGGNSSLVLDGVAAVTGADSYSWAIPAGESVELAVGAGGWTLSVSSITDVNVALSAATYGTGSSSLYLVTDLAGTPKIVSGSVTQAGAMAWGGATGYAFNNGAIRGNGGFQSSDGSAGATGSATAVNTLTIKNGLVTVIA